MGDGWPFPLYQTAAPRRELVCERLCLARRCNQDQGRQQALSPGKQSPSSQPGPELAMTQEEILEVKLLTVLEGFCVTWGGAVQKRLPLGSSCV